MEETLELGATSEFTNDFAVQLHKLLREIISTIRKMTQEASYSPSIEYFKSRDDVLENLRQARIQVMMATETFYQCLLSCREYLERTLNQW